MKNAYNLVIGFTLIVGSIGLFIYNFNEIETVETSNDNTRPLFVRNDIQYINNPNQKTLMNKFNKMENITIYTTIGSSMNPTISEGDKLICDSSIKDYKSGMIVVTSNYTHRIKSTYEDYLITQGDNNLYEDSRINYTDIECVVVGVLY